MNFYFIPKQCETFTVKTDTKDLMLLLEVINGYFGLFI